MVEFFIKERSKNSITLVFRGVDIGFLNLLSYELLQDPRVLNSYARKPHLLLEDIEFYVLVRDGTDIKELLIEKIGAIKESFLTFKKKFEEKLGEIHKDRS